MSPPNKRRFRVAYFATHPIQYQAPLLRYLAADTQIDLEVFFYSDFSLHQHVDPGYGVQFKWDVPLVDGYKYRILERVFGGCRRDRKSWLPARSFRRILLEGNFHAVWVHGWGHVCSLQAMLAAGKLGLPLLLRGESLPKSLARSGKRNWFVRQCHRGVFRRAAAFLCIGAANRAFYLEEGIPANRLFSMPYAVNNEFFQGKAKEAASHREVLRFELGLEQGRPIVLFAGRLGHDKAPDVLLDAVGILAKRTFRNSLPYLLFVGDGPLRHELEAQAGTLPEGIVRFLGFRNQTELPALYDLCNVFVLPSRFEPWGLVVNEVMNAGRPLIVSDRVGSAQDLVQPGLNGWIYPQTHAGALSACLEEAVADPQRLQEMGRRSLERIKGWDFETDRRGLLEALEKTCRV